MTLKKKKTAERVTGDIVNTQALTRLSLTVWLWSSLFEMLKRHLLFIKIGQLHVGLQAL